MNSRCASSKKNTSLGLSRSPTSGQVVEQVGEQPHQEGREERGPVLQVRQLEQGDDAAAVRGGAQEVRGLELRLAEEHVGALVLERDQLAQDHAGGRRREPAERP